MTVPDEIIVKKLTQDRVWEVYDSGDVKAPLYRIPFSEAFRIGEGSEFFTVLDACLIACPLTAEEVSDTRKRFGILHNQKMRTVDTDGINVVKYEPEPEKAVPQAFDVAPLKSKIRPTKKGRNLLF